MAVGVVEKIDVKTAAGAARAAVAGVASPVVPYDGTASNRIVAKVEVVAAATEMVVALAEGRTVKMVAKDVVMIVLTLFGQEVAGVAEVLTSVAVSAKMATVFVMAEEAEEGCLWIAMAVGVEVEVEEPAKKPQDVLYRHNVMSFVRRLMEAGNLKHIR